MDYSRYLVLYSGGADSTYFVEREKTARYLIHYEGLNSEQTRVAVVNANLLDKYITVERLRVGPAPPMDGETNAIHALYDTEMALRASITAVSFGMEGIVMCFNADDIGIDAGSIEQIMKRAEPKFKLLQPIRKTSAKEIRTALRKSNLRVVSCMHSADCGYCAKCVREREFKAE